MLRNTASYIQLTGGKGTESPENYHAMGGSQQDANQAMLYKGNTGCLKCITDQALSGLGTDKPQPFKGKRSSSRDPEKCSFPRPWPQPLLALASMHLVLDKEQVISPYIRVPEKVSDYPSPRNR